MARRRNHWGWGYEDERLSGAGLREAAHGLRSHLGFGSVDVEEPAAPRLPPARIGIPAELRAVASAEPLDRALFGHGRSYTDVVAGFRGDYAEAPDFVVHARSEADVLATLRWAADAAVAVVPVGGATSVVGGVRCEPGPGQAGAVALSLRGLASVLEVDPVSRSARIQAGATGPALEEQLAAHGMTLRFFPQSFEMATLGGWIATRAGGHFATGPTHIDDVVESIRAVTPAAGTWESRRLPGSGAGPSPDRVLLGSEGTLGVITEAWVRVLERGGPRAAASVRFPDFATGCAAVRDVVQAGLQPANCRLIDAREAALTFAGDGSAALLVLGFEQAVVEPRLEAAAAICEARGGEVSRGSGGGGGAWRDAFLRAPYVRDTLVAMGVLSETFETAITWERLDGFVAEVLEAARSRLHEACGEGSVSVRLTHAYPDGAAPYFTCVAPARRGEEVAQWQIVKSAVSDVIEAAGGTITHHHAVGRDHRPWYDRQRPEPFADGLRAMKQTLDPAGVLNPGVLL